MKTPDKINLLGTHFSDVTLETATDFLATNKFEKTEYVCFPSTGSISITYKDKSYQEILNKSLLTFVDGKFTEFYLKLKGYKRIKNVSGFWLLENLLKTERTHYFYGCDDAILLKLKSKLNGRFPSAKILGFKSPPFFDQADIYPNKQIIHDFKEINKTKPDFVWIGVSSPKQDFLMHHYKEHLGKGVMLGVGAVFLYHAGVENKGPEILKKIGMRWALRLLKNPQRIRQRKPFQNLMYFLWLIFQRDVLNKEIE